MSLNSSSIPKSSSSEAPFFAPPVDFLPLDFGMSNSLKSGSHSSSSSTLFQSSTSSVSSSSSSSSSSPDFLDDGLRPFLGVSSPSNSSSSSSSSFFTGRDDAFLTDSSASFTFFTEAFFGFSDLAMIEQDYSVVKFLPKF
ncbi:MAG: hypothetical protein EAZ17_08905 [Sphingobacteriales bacterium]|nr:MAG: hypothetical protein EAZ17_08905 [Sphingobacteriales bacterium]